MAQIEKTVFISYRRSDVYTALAVYENLKNQGYDVFFDYRSISSGDFEQIITSNIRARAHFLLILTPTALDRCNEPGDWLRREIELAIDERRNVIPLFFKGFRFGAPSVAEKLTGKLKFLSRYNGLNVHEDYFDEAIQRLSIQYLNLPLETVLHPVSTEVQKVVRDEQIAADKALAQIEDVKELVRHGKDMPVLEGGSQKPVAPRAYNRSWRFISGIVGGFLLLALLIWGVLSLNNFPSSVTSEPTQTLTTSTIPPRTLEVTSTTTPSPTSTRRPTPTHTLPPPTIASIISPKDGMTLLLVSAGEFTLGSDNGGIDEAPARKVSLAAFWIDQTEVTVRMYYACVQAGVCRVPINFGSATHVSYYGNETYDNYPVIYVDWNMAKTYCEWVDRRLPSGAEWEKAARGKDGRTFSWGNNSPNADLLNYNGNVGDTTRVGEFPNGASPYGAFDMAGNVSEWVNELYDPTDTILADYRVVKGGAWKTSAHYELRSAIRIGNPPGWANDDIGFRCAMSATS